MYGHNELKLILHKDSEGKETDAVIINLVRPIEELLDDIGDSLHEHTHFSIVSSYNNLIPYIDDQTTDILINFGVELNDLYYDYEIILMQTILDLGISELDTHTLTEVMDLFIKANAAGTPAIAEHELFEFAYENGITLTDMPDHAKEEDVVQEFIREVLEPAGFIYVQTNSGLSGYVEPDILYALRGD